MYNTFEEFEQLPKEVKNKIIRDLAAFMENIKFRLIGVCAQVTAAITALLENGAIKIYLKGCRS